VIDSTWTNGIAYDYTLENVVDYYPYGKVLRHYSANQNQEKYLSTHHQRDEETSTNNFAGGLDNRGARWYDSDAGRFLSLDPAATEYPSLSDYNYVAGNPIFMLDPDGRKLKPYHNRNSIDAQGLAKIAATTKGAAYLKTLIHANGVNGTFYLDEVFWSGSSQYDSRTNVISYAPSVYRFGFDEYNVLGHETAHAIDDRKGKRLYSRASQKLSEKRAVKFENYLRSVYGDGLRTAYMGVGRFSDDESLYNPAGEKIENIVLLRNSSEEGSWELSKGAYIETSFERKFGDNEAQTIYQRMSMGQNGEIDFQEFDNEQDLINSRPANVSN